MGLWNTLVICYFASFLLHPNHSNIHFITKSVFTDGSWEIQLYHMHCFTQVDAKNIPPCGLKEQMLV